MAYSGHPRNGDNDMTSPMGGWTTVIRFWPAAAAAAMCALGLSAVLAFAAAFGGSNAPAGPPADPSSSIAAQADAHGVGTVASSVSLADPRSGVAAQPDGAVTVASSVSLDPKTAASSWSMSPVQVAPAPAAPIAPGAAALAEQAKAAYGVDVLLAGQDWGADAAQQSQNIVAVLSAMQVSPVTIASSTSAGPGGSLAVLSNVQGRTSGGWQPYGNGARSFYTNSDQSAAGAQAANEIVLTTGADRMTVMHELLHAYQFRNVAPGEYPLAFLGDEMRSYIAATGWRQTVSDDQVRATAHEQWESIDTLYVYEGRQLTYTDVNDKQVTLQPANPLEAFAEAGALYYARPEGTQLPDWPEYWQWFQVNVGAASYAG